MKQKIFSKALQMLISFAAVSGILLSFSGCAPASSNLLVDGSKLKLEFDINKVKKPGKQQSFRVEKTLPEGLTFEKAAELFYPGQELREDHRAQGIAFLPASLPEDGKVVDQLLFDSGKTELYQDGKWTGTVQDCYRIAYGYWGDGKGNYTTAHNILSITAEEKYVGKVSKQFAAPADDVLEKKIADVRRIVDGLGYENYEIDIARKYTREGLIRLALCTYSAHDCGVEDTDDLPEVTYWIRVKLNGTVSGHNSHTQIDFLYSADQLYIMEAQAQITGCEFIDTFDMCTPKEALKAVSLALGEKELTLYDVYAVPYYMSKNKPAAYEPHWCFVFRDVEQAKVMLANGLNETIDCWRFNCVYVNAKGEVHKGRRDEILFSVGLYPITEYNK